MKSVRTTLAYAAAVVLVAFGLLALLNPLVAVRLVGLEVIEPRGLAEVRASYGAMVLALGGAMLWAIPTRPRSLPWIRLTALLLGAATLGRVASVVLDGVWTPLNLAIVALLAFLAVATTLAGFQATGRARRAAPTAAGADRADVPKRRRLGFGRRGRPKPAPNDADASAVDRAADDAGDGEPDPLRAYRG